MNTIGFTNYAQPVKSETPWQENYNQDTTIFGKNVFLPINYHSAQNDNTLVIGTSGTGKTYSFVEPNVLQGNANYVIADAKGDILADVGASLKKMGYQIQVLNLVDLKHSMTYNPILNMKSNLDVINFAHQVMISDVSGNQTTDSRQDPFWNNAAMTVLEALIFFTQEFLPESEQTMSTVVRLFGMLEDSPKNIEQVLVSLGDSDYNYEYEYDDDLTFGDCLFNWAVQEKPDSEAAKMWQQIAGLHSSDRTWGSVLGILGAALSPYRVKEVDRLLSSNQVDFSQLLKPKKAFFILYDDSDPSKNFISNTLYSQLFSFLYHAAFKLEGKTLPVKVRFFLDDFKNILIPHFDDYLATARSRNISICMMLQDESQLKAKFGNNTPSVIGNCSAYLLTGTTDLAMAQTASSRFERSAKMIRLMNEDHFLLDVGGYIVEPVRYDFHNHPHFIDKRFNINNQLNTANDDGDDSCKWPELADILKSLPGIEMNDVELIDSLF